MGSTRGILIGILLLAGVGFIMWQLATSETLEPPAPARGGAAEPAPLASRPTAAVETSPVAISPNPFREAPEPATPAGPASKTQSEGRTLKVILVPEQTPAVGASVDFTPMSPSGELGHMTRGLIADSEGTVTLPKFRGNARVRGELRDRCGSAHLSSGELAGYTLELAKGIAALVVDETDAPQAGVEVLIQAGEPISPPVDRAVTGSDGIAHLAAPRPDEDGRRRGRRETRVAVAAPLDEPVEAVIDPAKLPDEPVKLVLRQTGRLVVRLVTSERQPFTGEATVELRKLPSQTFRLNDPPDGRRVAAAAGIATFPHVGLGPHLEIEVTPQDVALRKVRSPLNGTRRAGETVTEVVCGGKATVFRGRLLKGDGKPVVRANIEVDFRTVDGEPRGFSERGRNTTTAADGRFEVRFDVDPATVSPEGLKLVILKVIPMGGRGSMVEPGQEIALTAPPGLATGIADLGDVFTEELGLIVSGMVVSEKGTPITQARLEIAWSSPGGWVKSPSDFEIRGGTDGGGKFEIRGKLKGKEGLGLVAEREGWICAGPVPFHPGATNVKVVMTRGGAIAGSFEGLDREDTAVWTKPPLEVSVVRSGSTVSRTKAIMVDALGQPERHEVRPYGGKFTQESLSPGSYSVEIYAAVDFRPGDESPKPLMVVEGVIVEVGKTTRDPRLQNMELAKLMKLKVVSVVDEAGRPLRRVRIGARMAGSSGGFTPFSTGESGKAVVAMPADTVEIVASLKGYRTVTLPQVTDDATVTLEETAPKLVTIKLEDGTDLPADPFSIAARLDWLCAPNEKPPESSRDYDPRNTDRRTVTFGKDRTASFEVDDAGIYAVQILLYERFSLASRRGSPLDSDKKRTRVTVTESGATVTIPLDAENLRKRMKKE